MEASFVLFQSMTVGGAQRQAIYLFDLLDFFKGLRGERGPTFESMKDNSLKQVAQTHIFQLSDRFQHFEQPLFQANACLHPVDFDAFLSHGYQCTMVAYGRQGPWALVGRPFTACSVTRRRLRLLAVSYTVSEHLTHLRSLPPSSSCATLGESSVSMASQRGRVFSFKSRATMDRDEQYVLWVC
jgi:hypothetical protein